MIKIAGVRRKRARRSACAYEAKNMQGETMFFGVASSAADSAYGASQEALVEPSIKARNTGFHQVLILSNSRRLVQTVNKERSPNWQERTMMADLSSLHQNGFVLKMLFVPKVVINSVCYVANIATTMPFHQCWSRPAICNKLPVFSLWMV